MAEALADGTPMPGIRLGGQMLAQVAGGTVRAAHATPEYGSTTIRLRPEAGAEPLLAGLGETVPAIERHVDVIAGLPPRAVWPAASEDRSRQAFRVGQRAWGARFHPEADAAVAVWDRAYLAERGLDADRLHARAVAAEAASVTAWSVFTRRFAQVCRA